MYICRSIVRVAWGGECWEDMDCWWWNFWHEILRCSVIVILSPYLRVVAVWRDLLYGRDHVHQA